MLTVRKPEDVFQTEGSIQNGAFRGRWHFSFGDYRDAANERFGALLVFNDDTLTPGAIWPLHPHHDIEVVTCCVEGEFRHADEHGRGGVLRKGGVQHTTVGSGMWHSEINNSGEAPMRFIQMWFQPLKMGLRPSVAQRPDVDRADRTDRLLPLVQPEGKDGALAIRADATVYASFLRAGKTVRHNIDPGRGAYLYVVEGGAVYVNNLRVEPFGAAKATAEKTLAVRAERDCELVIVDVMMIGGA